MYPNVTMRHYFWILTLVSFFIVLLFVILVHEKKNIRYMDKVGKFSMIITKSHDHTKASYLVDTPFCRVPKLKPYDGSIAHLLHNDKHVLCNMTSSLTYQDGDMIHVNWSAIAQSRYNDTFSFCLYNPIYRPRQGKKSTYFKYLKRSKSFNISIHVHEEFIRVQCLNKKKHVIYTNFYAFIIEKDFVVERQRRVLKNDNTARGTKDTLNVLMLGIDSVSRLNSVRRLKKTRQYLLQELDSFEFLGYNKVGLNTFPNLVPMLTGKHVKELLGNKILKHHTSFDDYVFIWKNFTDEGYRTLFAEDAPGMSAFDYLKAGFRDIPTDYFFRPFSVAMDSEKRLWYLDRICMMDRSETEIILDYTLKYMIKFRSQSLFSLAFVSRITHGVSARLATLDQIYLKFLKILQKSGFLNNTILFFFSDHGMRFEKISRTYYGSIEEKMPMMHIVIPKKFKRKYPEILKNVQINTMRLTTPFDIYETLKDILDYRGMNMNKDVNSRGVSLFDKVPVNRNCSNAGIPMEFCSCVEFVNANVSRELAETLCQDVVEHINTLLHSYNSRCHALKLRHIISAMKKKSYQKENKSHTDLSDKDIVQVKFETQPGGAIFEATCQYSIKSRSCKVIGVIERLNLYGKQSHCVDDVHIRNYCLGRENINFL